MVTKTVLSIVLMVLLLGCDVPNDTIGETTTWTPAPMSNTATVYVSKSCIIRHVKVDNYPSFYLVESKGGGIKCAIAVTDVK